MNFLWLKIRHVTVIELINVPTCVQLIRLDKKKVDFSMSRVVCFSVSNLLMAKASPTCIIHERRQPMFLCTHCLVLYRAQWMMWRLNAISLTLTYLPIQIKYKK